MKALRYVLAAPIILAAILLNQWLDPASLAKVEHISKLAAGISEK